MTMQVKQIKWPRDQKQHKGHNLASVFAGDTVFGIQHQETGQFFYYAYLYDDIAERVAQRLETADIPANFKRQPAVVTSRTKIE